MILNYGLWKIKRNIFSDRGKLFDEIKIGIGFEKLGSRKKYRGEAINISA